MTCDHRDLHDIVNDRCFEGCVTPDDCNPAAHGHMTWTAVCRGCGMRRRVNANGRHSEYGPWFWCCDHCNLTTGDADQPTVSARWIDDDGNVSDDVFRVCADCLRAGHRDGPGYRRCD